MPPYADPSSTPGVWRLGLEFTGYPMILVDSIRLLILVFVLGNGLSVAAALVLCRWPGLWNSHRTWEG